ncbi:MAG: SIMPL domain-containing protein [Chloroflexi bacterium]|nr:SIMPL domain-containing protein [Chloroflexota bacterium]
MKMKVLLALGTILALLTVFCVQATPTPTPAPVASPSPTASSPGVMPTPGGITILPGETGSLSQRIETGSGTMVAPLQPSMSYISVPTISNQQMGLWVSGSGTVSAAPDVAQLSVGVEVQDKTVADAQRRARDAMNAIRKVLLDSGVAEKDIKTTSFNIYQVTQWIDRLGQEEIVGYRVSNMISVKVRNLDNVGAIIDGVAEAGGDVTRINSISFSVDDPTLFLTQAREEAMKDAMAKAKQMAELAEVTLGKPIYITEGSSYSVPTPYPYAMKAMEGAAAPTPISAGENQFTVTVQIVFAIE